MDEESGPSRPKRATRWVDYGLTENEIEDYLDWDNGSDDNFDPLECDTSSDDDEEAEDRRLIVENALLDLVPLLPTQSSSRSSQVSEEAPSAAETPARIWSTSGELRQIEYCKQNKFFEIPGNTPISYFNFFFEDVFLTRICEKTNAQAVKLYC